MKPMLAADISEDLDKLRFPLFVTPKLDGVRALITPTEVLSRSLKPIPNKHVQKVFCDTDLVGLDGELIAGSPTAEDVFRVTSKATASIEGEPQVTFYAFDEYTLKDYGYRDRLHQLQRAVNFAFSDVRAVPSQLVLDMDELERIETKYLEEGYEGVILRSPEGKYKHGRSTVKEQGMLKLKRFKDSEALVIGIEEEMENRNEAKVNALGHVERSTHKANLVGKGTMGALVVRDIHTGVEFKLGTGFTAEDRRRTDWVGKHVKYKYFPIGIKDKPRIPSYLGIREEHDL